MKVSLGGRLRAPCVPQLKQQRALPRIRTSRVDRSAPPSRSLVLSHSLSTQNPSSSMDFITRDRTGLMLFNLPVAWPTLLGLRGRPKYLDSEIRAAVEEALALPVEEGYSPTAISGRVELIEGAADVMRSNGNMPPRDAFIQIPWDLLPGMLALLCEVGEYDLVLQVGTRAAPSRQQWEFQRDVLLSMALAHMGLARDSLGGGDQVAMGCGRMEEALRILEGAGDPPLAPALRAELTAALASLAPYVALDALRDMPAVEDQGARRETLRTLRALLNDPLRRTLPPRPLSARFLPPGPDLTESDPAPSPLNAAYMRVVLQRLTSTEVVGLMDWLAVVRDPSAYPQGEWTFRGLGQAVARAHLTAGLIHRRPSLVARALEILRLSAGDGDVTQDRVAACILLGRVREATDLIRIGDRDADSASLEQQEAWAFVRRHSPDPSDLLPGLCALAQTHLARECCPLSRDFVEEGRTADLGAYFDDPRVTQYLSMEGGLPGPLSRALEGLEDLALAMQRSARSLADALARPLARHPPRAAAYTAPLALPMGRLVPPEQSAARLGVSSLALGASLLAFAHARPSLTLPPSLAGALEGAGIVGAAGSALERARGAVEGARGWVHRGVGGGPVTAGLEGGLEGAERRPSPEAHVAPLSSAQAEALIKEWQRAKALALGPEHDASALPAALAEPLLSTWEARAAEARRSGWFWKYILHEVKVESVDTSSFIGSGTRGFIAVSARIQETADLWNPDGRPGDSYRSAYQVEYEVVREGGAWKIAHGRVTH